MMMLMQSLRTRVLGALCVVLGVGAASSAAAGGVGPRVGLTGDPDQVHFGLAIDAFRLAPNFGFAPSFDVGVGNDITLFSGNFDFKYVFPVRSSWRPYIGGGPALHFVNIDNSNDDTQAGLAFIGGMQTATRSGAFFTELRLGLVDSPDFKFTVGWLFR
jgi:hypothetical protein